MKKNKILSFIIIISGLGVGVLISLKAIAYREPIVAPPSDAGSLAPLSTGPLSQTKSGSLSVDVNSGAITFLASSPAILFSNSGFVNGTLGLFDVPGMGTTLALSTPGNDLSPLAAWSEASGTNPFSSTPLNIGIGGAPLQQTGTVGELLLGNNTPSSMPMVLDTMGATSSITIGAYYDSSTNSWMSDSLISKLSDYQPMQISFSPSDLYFGNGVTGSDGSVTWINSFDINGSNGTVLISDRNRGSVPGPGYNRLSIENWPAASELSSMTDYTSQYCQQNKSKCYTDTSNNSQCLSGLAPQAIYDSNLCNANTKGNIILLRKWLYTGSGSSCPAANAQSYSGDLLEFYQCNVNPNDPSYNTATLNVGQLKLKNQQWSDIVKISTSTCTNNNMCYDTWSKCPNGYLLVGVKLNKSTGTYGGIPMPFGTIYCAKP